MKVKMLASAVGAVHYRKGRIYDLPPEKAKRFIDLRRAVLAETGHETAKLQPHENAKAKKKP